MQSSVFDLRGNPAAIWTRRSEYRTSFCSGVRRSFSVKSRESRLGDKDWAAESGCPIPSRWSC
ncbi:MAG: hypothetical protein IPJ07_23450 [Acidobacteria bacterium]|nr:hypothetical protein [Acidobacteriota bacterium]